MGRKGKYSKRNHLRSRIETADDISISSYERPPKTEWDSEEVFTVALSQTSRLHVRTSFFRGVVIDFCISQQVGGPYEWDDLLRIDCAHDTVHQHDFVTGKEVRSEIESISDSKVVEKQYAEQYEFVLNTAAERERIWRNESRKY